MYKTVKLGCGHVVYDDVFVTQGAWKYRYCKTCDDWYPEPRYQPPPKEEPDTPPDY